MQSPESYLNSNDLWDVDKLRQHAEHHLVYFITSPRFPNLVMLHYRDECQFDRKWSTFSRMSRGLILDLKNKKVLAHPHDKFFNLGQMSETFYDNLLELGEFEVSEKLDGSMCILFQDPNTGNYHVTTKGSFDSDHGIYGTQIIPEQVKRETYVNDYTLMFELIDPRFQIVIDYRKKGYPFGLYLVGVRHRISNQLLSYKEVQRFAKDLNIPTIKTYDFRTLDQLIENAKTLPVLEEGYVLRFPSTGLLVKVKGTEYLRAHRFISKLSDKYILEYLGTGEEKQLLDLAPEEYREEVEEKIVNYRRKCAEITDQCYEWFNKAPKDTRKDFALWVLKEVEPFYKGFLFNLFDQKPIERRGIYRLIAEQEKASTVTKI